MRETILLIEDDIYTSSILSKELKSEGYDVVCCYDGKSALDELKNTEISIILLDFILPNMTRLSFLTEIKKRNYDIPVIMLTSINHSAIQKQCLAMGIHDYVVKPCCTDLLVKKIQFVLDERLKISEINDKLWSYENLEVNFSTKMINLNGNKIYLGKTPMEILNLLVNNRGMVLSRNTIIDYVWGTCCDINDRTVDAHISKIRRSLNLDCLKTVPGYGYILECKNKKKQ